MKRNQAFKYPFQALNNRYRNVLIFLISSFSLPLFSQSNFLDSLLKVNLPQYHQVLNNPEAYRLQVFYTQINRDAKNKPHLTTHSFRTSSDYIYPASTVKLPLSILALMKIEDLKIKGLENNTAMITDSAFHCRKQVKTDSSSGSGYPTVENYIKKMLLVSDNQAYARTFDFVTYGYAQPRLVDMGLENVRLLNRLEMQCAWDTVKGTAPVYFLNKGGDTIYKQGITLLSENLAHPIKKSTAGSFHQSGNKWIKGPKDFSSHNYLQPKDLHRLMEMLVFNKYVVRDRIIALHDNNRKFLLKQLGSYPRESDHPMYDPKQFYDSYKKYLIYGAATAQIKQDSIRVINIVGRAYGFLIDCAYIIDLKNNLEFFITCAIYVNKNGKIGSGKYEYDQLGLPFMRDLGWCIYNYERKRKKEYDPDLSEFKTLFNKN